MSEERPDRPLLRSVQKEPRELRVARPESIAAIISEPLPTWIVQNVLMRDTVVALFGGSGVGKTFVALNWSASIATGRDVDGRCVRQGAVLYVAAEGRSGLNKRLRALVHQYPDVASAPLRVLRQQITLPTDTEDLLIRAKDIHDDAGPLQLVVLDTLSQTIDGDENGPDMALYMRAATRLAQELHCAALVVHHTGKDASRGMRGHSSARANVDCSYELVKARDDILMYDNKVRDTEKTGVVLGCRLRPVPVGRDLDGIEHTSCVVEYLDVAARDAERPPLTGSDRKLLWSLAGECARTAGHAGHLDADGVSLFEQADLARAWRAAKEAAGNKKQAAPTYFSRALEALLEHGYLARHGDSSRLKCLR